MAPASYVNGHHPRRHLSIVALTVLNSVIQYGRTRAVVQFPLAVLTSPPRCFRLPDLRAIRDPDEDTADADA